uniref:Secreted protein n=1 Tax=Oryza punctata TaxID=4537 RepID=A0A0E0JV84_ORYPU
MAMPSQFMLLVPISLGYTWWLPSHGIRSQPRRSPAHWGKGDKHRPRSFLGPSCYGWTRTAAAGLIIAAARAALPLRSFVILHAAVAADVGGTVSWHNVAAVAEDHDVLRRCVQAGCRPTSTMTAFELLGTYTTTGLSFCLGQNTASSLSPAICKSYAS